MSKRAKRLGVVLNIKQELFDKVTASYKQAQHAWLVENQKLEQLISYRKEYLTKMNTQQNIKASALQNYFKFIAQLDGAINQQQQQVSLAQKAKESHYNEYLSSKKEVESIKKMVQSELHQQQLLADKLLQKEIDEYAQKQWYSNRNPHD